MMGLESHLELIKSIDVGLVGIGVTAFNRSNLLQLDVGASVLCYVDGTDVDRIKRIGEVVSLQGDLGVELEAKNTISILQNGSALSYLRSKGTPALLVYKSTKNIEDVCDRHGFKLLANRSEVRDIYEDKESFFKLGREIGLPMIDGEQWLISEIDGRAYEQVKKSMGERLVFQVTGITTGGGKGTFFVDSENDFRAFLKQVRRMNDGMRIEKVNITRFIEGVSPSITGCVTRHGVLTGVVQTQVVDVPELGEFEGRKGKFQGHDWSYRHYEDWVQEQADEIATTLGKHMMQRGYKGIFGVDLIVDEKKHKVYPVECNPRYTGAFPVYSMLQRAEGEIPIDVFQLLEFLEIDYDMSLEEVNRAWKVSKEGAHLVLCNNSNDKWVFKSDLLAGVYVAGKDGIEHVRRGVMFEDIRNEDEVVLTDGCPRAGQVVKPGARLGKLVFGRGVLEEPGKLLPDVRELVGMVFKGMDYQVVIEEDKDGRR